MATAKKIQSDISSLKIAIRVAKNDAIKKKLKQRLEMAENELASIKSGAKPRKVSTSKGTKSLLERAKALVKKNPKFAQYKGSGVDLEKDAKEGALPIGRRISKGLKANQISGKGNAKQNKGNVYYEYRVNRLDVKQPKGKQSYPKLESGGYMAKGGELKNKLKYLKENANGYFPNIAPKKETSYYLWEIPNNEKVSFIIERRSIYGDVGSEFYVYDKDFKYKGSASQIQGFSNVKPIKITQSDVHYADGGYMAKGGEIEVGDSVIVELNNGKIIQGKIEKLNPYKIRTSPSDTMVIPNSLLLSIKKLSDVMMANGGYMAKGGALEHGLMVGDVIMMIPTKAGEDTIGVRNQNDGMNYVINLNTGERKSAKSVMAHGGETHRAEDPEEVEIDEDEMKVVRGYSDDEAYEYAKGGMTLKAGDIVEATTGVKLKVMDFKPDFGGRALVQRIDEFGEGLKPVWMPLTKFKLPKLI